MVGILVLHLARFAVPSITVVNGQVAKARERAKEKAKVRAREKEKAREKVKGKAREKERAKVRGKEDSVRVLEIVHNRVVLCHPLAHPFVVQCSWDVSMDSASIRRPVQARAKGKKNARKDKSGSLRIIVCRLFVRVMRS
jgi:hypothetical protein